MKFLCSNCKAKYQIADEKIAGRTLRMKCRRCGHDIVLHGDEALAKADRSGASVLPASAPPAPAQTPGPVHAPAGGRRAAAGAPAPARLGTKGTSNVGPYPARPAAQARGTGSALGAEFRRQMAAGPQEPARQSVAPTLLDQWHVAIHDVPVGPMRREELARKIAAGAVSADSLVWREGFDDWRPLRDVTELSPLLRRSIPPPAAPAPRPPTARGTAQRPVTGARPATARTPSPRAPATSSTRKPATQDARPAARSNVVPIGGRLGAAALPAFDDIPLEDSDLEPDAPTRVSHAPSFEEPIARPSRASQAPPSSEAAMAAAAAHAEPPAAMSASVDPFAPMSAPSPVLPPSPVFTPQLGPPRGAGGLSPMTRPLPAVVEVQQRRSLPIGAWIAIAGAGAFGVALAAMVGAHFLTANEVAAPAPQQAPPARPQAPLAVPDQPTQPQATQAEAEQEEQAQATTTKRRSGSSSRSGGASEPSTPRPTRQLSAAEQQMIERMQGGGASPNLEIEQARAGSSSSGTSSGGGGGGEGLNAAQIRTVVTRNRPSLQQCYETAIRGTGSDATVRMDVDITIGASGTVVRVDTHGSGLGDMANCLARSVRRWRFPSASESTHTTFPVVFQPGS